MKHLILTFVLLLSCFPMIGKADDKPSLTADEIVNKHLEAAGGREALKKIRSRVAVGTIKKEDDPESQMAIMSEAPNRVSAMFVFKRYDWQLTYDGTNPFVRPIFPRDLVAFQDKYYEILSSGLMFNSISLYNLLVDREASGAKFEAKGTKKLRDRQVYLVDVKLKGRSARLYFDAQTFMWVRTDFGKAHISKPMGAFTNAVVPHGQDEVSVDFYFETSDFRDVDGLKLPFKFQQVVTFPVITQKTSGTLSGTIVEYKHNVDIDPKMFK